MNEFRLTNMRHKVLRALARFVEENGYMPSVRELAERVDVKSHSSVHFHLECLLRDGFLTHKRGRARSWRLTRKADHALESRWAS